MALSMKLTLLNASNVFKSYMYSYEVIIDSNPYKSLLVLPNQDLYNIYTKILFKTIHYLSKKH
jgi:hypothetical protein